MDDDLARLMRDLKAAKKLLPEPEAAKPAEEPMPAATGTEGRTDEGERKVSLGDVAKQRKDYEREPPERK